MSEVNDHDLMPREKLALYGVEKLESWELLAIIFGTGYKKESVVELSQRIFQEYSPRSITTYQKTEEIVQELGLPPVKSAQLLACLGIGRRVFYSDGAEKLRSPEEVWRYCQDTARGNKEILRGIYLNVKNRVVHDEVISVGTVSESIAHPREILGPALRNHASSLILVHNHPSGDLTPSQADIDLTHRIEEASRLLGISFLDHIIVSEEDFRSIR
jgi:DNA repair protein RadC